MQAKHPIFVPPCVLHPSQVEGLHGLIEDVVRFTDFLLINRLLVCRRNPHNLDPIWSLPTDLLPTAYSSFILRREVPELMHVEVRRDVAIQVASAAAVRDFPECDPRPTIDLLERGRLKQVTTHCPQRNAGVINVAIRVNPREQSGVAVEVLELKDI